MFVRNYEIVLDIKLKLYVDVLIVFFGDYIMCIKRRMEDMVVDMEGMEVDKVSM